MQGLAEKAVADIGARMGRPPLGLKAADTKKTHVRLEASMLAEVERVRGSRTMAAYLREAVAEKLAREKKGRTYCADSRDEVNRG